MYKNTQDSASLKAIKVLSLLVLAVTLEGCIAHAAGYALGTAQVLAQDAVKRSMGILGPRAN